MAKMKFFKMLVLMLCICLVPTFAGCSLVTTNLNKQLNEIAIGFDNNRVTVTLEELIMTYNSTGNSRFDNSSTPTKAGVESTLDLALNRSILVDFLTAEDKATERAKFNVSKVELTTYQQNEVWQNVYDYINSSVTSIENELRTEEDKRLPTASEEEEDDTAYTPYKKQYAYTSNGTLIKLDDDEVEVANKSIALLTAEQEDLAFSEKAKIAYYNFRTKYWNYTDSIVLTENPVNTTSFSDRAWSKWINQLLRNEIDRNLSKVDAEAFLRQVEKIYNVYYQNAVLTAFQEQYEAGLNITAEMVAQKFNELYSSQKELYDTNPSAFNSAMPTSAEGVYYVKNPEDFFKVNHILIKFSDEQNTAIKNAEQKLSNMEYKYSDYQNELASIKSNTKAYNRETGEYETADQVLKNLKNQLATAQSTQDKLAIFRNFMHIYSQDDATLNAEACYYIPVDNNKIEDVMEPAFAEGSRDLYNNGNGNIGDISLEFVETSYGYHIIMYTGKAESVENTNNLSALLANLDAYRLNPLYNKTMLDKVIEQVTLTSYATFETSILESIKEGKTIVRNQSVYSYLY